MKKNLIILAVGILLFTGCTPTYNLTIKESSIDEELIIENDINNYADEFNELYAIVDESKKYDYKKMDNKATFQYNYSLSKINSSNMIKSCYESFRFERDGDSYILQTGLKFNCYPFQIRDYELINYDSLKVNIKIIGYDVLKNNADSINENIYTWIIDKTNYTNKPIIMELKKNVANEIGTNKNDKKINSTIILVISIFSLIIVLVLSIMVFNKKNNKL